MKSKRTNMNLPNIFAVLLLIFAATCTRAENSMTSGTHRASQQQHDQADDCIGFVNMEADGTLVLNLNAALDGKAVGHGYFRYPPGHPEYEEVLRHVGPIKPGASKPVRPWPETSEVHRQHMQNR